MYFGHNSRETKLSSANLNFLWQALASSAYRFICKKTTEGNKSCTGGSIPLVPSLQCESASIRIMMNDALQADRLIMLWIKAAAALHYSDKNHT
jgi:hypothetical protein